MIAGQVRRGLALPVGAGALLGLAANRELAHLLTVITGRFGFAFAMPLLIVLARAGNKRRRPAHAAYARLALCSGFVRAHTDGAVQG